MMNELIGERVAYLQGLADGLEYNQSTKEGQLLKGVLEVLSLVSEELNGLNESIDELEERYEGLDELFEDFQEIFDQGDLDEFDDEDDDENGAVSVHCPHCDKIVFLTEFVSEAQCPACGEIITVEEKF